MVSLQMDIRNKLESIERLNTSILTAVRPSQKVIIPKDLPNLPLKSLKEFDANEKFLTDKANRADTVSSKIIPHSKAFFNVFSSYC